MITNTEYMKLIIGFLVGALIGFERQIAETTSERSVEGEWRPGVRTFGLFSLLGTVSALFYFSPETQIAFQLALIFSIIMAMSIIIVYTVMRFLRNPRDIGITTSVALSLAYLTGLLVGFGNITLGVTISIFVTFILAMKRSTERFLMNVEYMELSSALQIGILWTIIYPLVPDIVILGSVNFRTIYLFMLIVLLLSFLAYIVVKNLGPKNGIVAFAFIGALVSSEATTVSIIRMMKRIKIEEKAKVSSMTAGLLIANSTMILRTLALTALYLWASLEAIESLVILLLPPAIVGLAFSILRLRRVKVRGMPPMELGNPLSYKGAARFTFLFLLVSVAVVLLQKALSNFGLLIASALGGLVSVLAVSISIASLYLSGNISLEVALEGISVGVIAAVLNKIIYVRFAERLEGEPFKKALRDMLLLAFGVMLTYLLWEGML